MKLSINMTIDFVNILTRFLPLKTLEMAFQGIKISKFSGGACMSKTPLVARPYRARLIRRWLNKIHIYILKKLDSLSFCVNMVPSRNLDYIFYSAFDSSKGKNRLDNGQNATNLEITILGKLNISKNSGGSSKFPGGLNVIHTTTQTAFVTPVREYFF